MKIFNTLSRTKEEFIPLKEKHVKIYACGPTVYNYIHIGNARPLCVFDVLRRYLEYRGYKVDFVQNFTDVDDKIIKRANEENLDYKQVASKYISEYKIDAEGLNILEATIHPTATDNMKEIIELIEALMQKGFAYVAKQGDVYFRTTKFDEYGKLSHLPLDELKAGARIAIDDEKEQAVDFALWKAAKPTEPYWEAPWGKGRPGWHIECSAMAKRYLGDTIDIHCGGQDLIFPHHENEIAQSECCTGKPFARYWLHNGYINVDNKKMSKSAGNFFTVRDVANEYGYEAIRYLMIASHYRSPINYSTELLVQCKAALERLYNCKQNLLFAINNASNGQIDKNIQQKLEKHRDDFIAAMDDDLNTADAIAAIFELVKDINNLVLAKEESSKQLCEFALNLFLELTSVLGLLYSCEDDIDLSSTVEQMIEKRNKARKERDFATADKIRDELKDMGIILEDTANGVKWKKWKIDDRC